MVMIAISDPLYAMLRMMETAMIDWSQCPDVESVPDWVEVDHLAATSEQVEPECEDSTPGATQGSRASVRRIAICPCLSEECA